MKILMAISTYHRRGGFPRHGADLATAFAARGHDVTVLTRSVEAGERDAGIEFVRYHVPEPTMLVGMALEPKILGRKLREMSSRFDAVLTIGIPVYAPAVLVGPGTHRGYFRSALASLPKRAPRRWIEMMRPFHRIVMHGERGMLEGGYAQTIVVGGRNYAREYEEMFGIPSERIAVIPHGIDLAEFRFDPEARERLRGEMGVGPDEPLMLNVAGRSRQKGLDVLCAALGLLRTDRPWTFAIAGDGSTSPALARRTRDLRASGRVRLLGRVPSVRDLYSAADLLVFPSRYDPWGMAVTEALACGLPVISSSHIGSAAAVRHGSNGVLLADHQDPGEVARAVVSLLSKPYDRDEIARSVAGFGWDATAAALEPVLQRTTARQLEAKGVS